MEKDGVTLEGEPTISVIGDASALSDARLERLFLDWQKARIAEGLPPREFIDPSRLVYLLGSLLVFEVHEAPLRFRYRLIGTNVVDRIGVELTGRWLDQHPDVERREFIAKTLRMAWQAQQPVLFAYNMRAFNRVWPGASLVLPVAGSDSQPPLLLVGQTFPPDMPRWRRPKEDEA